MYAMYESGIPYVTDKINTTNIVGELYRVDKYTLHSLDMLEGHPRWYKRKQVEILFIDEHLKNFTEDDVKYKKAWLYFNDDIPNSATINETGIYGAKEGHTDLL